MCEGQGRIVKVGSLCTGYGGLDMAVGGELAWVSDIDKAANTLLEYRHPTIPNLGDLKVVDWSAVEPVDVITAGYPCQPFSVAGKRKGIDDERHIWPWIIEAIRVLRPACVVLENVPGHLRSGLGDVLGSLAEAGYDAKWCCVRASDVGAPHRRERVFIVASDTNSERHGGGENAGSLVRDAGGLEIQTRQRQRTREIFSAGTPRWNGGAPHLLARRGHELARRDARFVEWMMGLPAGWVTDVPGLSRTGQLRLLGNGVVPQQAAYALSVLDG